MPVINLTGAAPMIEETVPRTTISLDDAQNGTAPDGEALALPNTADPAEIADILDRLDAVYLEFPDFRDGRAFSQAALLRSRYGFTGEIRACGEVLCDQALFMARCGFDVLEIGAGDPDGFLSALSAFSFAYQQSAADGPPVWRLRATRRKKAAA